MNPLKYALLPLILLGRILAFIFGSFAWSPPGWIRKIARGVAELASQLNQSRRNNPAAFTVKALLFLAVLAAGGYGIHYWVNLPEPYKLTVSGTWPPATKLEKDAKPSPLVVRFSGSAAPLDKVGKDIDRGLTVAPAVAGIWRWASDSELTFTPASDWEVGRKYTVNFARDFFPKHVLLSEYAYQFETAKFQGEISNIQFYDDPTDPLNKKVVATLKFSHPVNKAALERDVSLKFREEPNKSFSSAEARSLQYKVSYKEDASEAYIHSEQIKIPNKPGEVLLTVNQGIRAQKEGPGLEAALTKTVAVPSVDDYFRIDSVNNSVVNNKDDEPEHVLSVETTVGVTEQALKDKIEVYLLPKDKPAIGSEKIKTNHRWSDANEVVPEVLAASLKIPSEVLPTEQDYSKVRGVRYSAEIGRHIFVRVGAGLKSYGGFALTHDYTALFEVPQYPRDLKIMHEGSLLSLTGAKKLSVMGRNLSAVKFALRRILPHTIHHLISQSGGIFQKPYFNNYEFDFENISEESESIEILPQVPPGKAQYTTFDFSKLIRSDGDAPRGLFMLEVQGYDPIRKEGVGIQDERLILLTDLGVLAKDSRDGSHDLFVQSIRDGAPLSGVTVQVLGKNGVAVLSAETDSLGHVTFPAFKDFKREKAPVAYLLQKGADSSFLPLERGDRAVNLSRFDSGGVRASSGEENLQGYLFTDRGIYRPGEEATLAILLRDNQWRPLPPGLPLELSISDARGIEVKREKLAFDAVGFKETRFATREESPVGTYHAELSIVRDTYQRTLLGTTAFKVEEFLPDRMTIKALLDPAPGDGWVSPDALKVNVSLRNLFGIPAADRKIKASFRLAPAFPIFPKYREYNFADPFKSKNSFEDSLGEKQTDAEGLASFDLNLSRFERGLYKLNLLTEGFEAQGGRSVRADASAIVSSLPLLVGYKLDGATDFLKKGSSRIATLISIAPTLELIEPKNLSVELVETRYVSALTKQDSGVLAYQSVKREIVKSKSALTLTQGTHSIALDTSTPGNFALVVKDDSDLELNRIAYTVVGDANLSSSLEKNAELQIKLNKNDYAPGEEIEVQIQAPYVGAGLISIEQEKVHAFSWFETDTTASVQKIRLPETLEGNGYLTVSFVRSLDSKEIFTSPVSHGTVPFTVSKARHQNAITLSTPQKVKPGEVFKIGYDLDPKSYQDMRVAIAAVDEGILQVAKFKTPDPLAHFFRKRALEVNTLQILDLLLPEYDIVRELSAAGGDEDAFLARNLNPFKRKGQKSVAYWSGIFTPERAKGEVQYLVPEYFNGTLRVYALAVSGSAIGVSEAKSLVQGDFVISPNVPLFAAPGDTFEVTASVANNISGSAELPLDVTLKTGAALSVVSDPKVALKVKEAAEGTATFKLKANQVLGDTDLSFSVESAKGKAHIQSNLSIRPPTTLRTEVYSGVVAPGIVTKNSTVKLSRSLYPEFRELDAGVSHSPLVLAFGLSKYLKSYPHGCTEQIVSQAFPEMLLSAYPEFGLKRADVEAHLDRTFSILYGRQNGDGGFSLWGGSSDSLNFESAYVTHFLLEARERGFNPPEAMLDRAITFQRNLLDQETDGGLASYRTKAYAIYLLTRNGQVTTNQIATLREALDAEFGQDWKSDLLALYLGAAYKMLKLDREGDQVASKVALATTPETDYENYYDNLSYSGQFLSLISQYFPKRAAKEATAAVLKMSEELALNRFNTISSAYTILAFDHYTKGRVPTSGSDIQLEQTLVGGAKELVKLPDNDLALTSFSDQATELKFSNSGTNPIYLFASATGLDRELPKAETKRKLEVYREYRNQKGEVVTSAKQGEELTVNVLVRTISESGDLYVSDLAVVDLLPGGLEVDANGRALLAQQAQGEQYWAPVSADVREDRVILFGSADPTLLHFSYRAKATTKGSFVIPPLYAYSMYDRSIESLTLGGTFEVM